MNILAGLRAIERTPCADFQPKETRDTIKKYKWIVRDMSKEEIEANNKAQVSTVVKMCLDGFTVDEIMRATKVSDGNIYAIKKQFSLVRATREDHKRAIKNALMEAPPYTYQLWDLSEKVGIDKTTVSRIISDTPQIQKGNTKGITKKYIYNFDVKVVTEAITSRGTVR